MLKETTLFGVTDKVKEAVEILRKHEPPEGYYLCFSGGKDSLCCYYLCQIAGVKYDAHYNFTTVDPPELVAFVRTFDDVKIEHPGVENTMWNLIVKKRMPPTRIARWCCETLKEGCGKGRVKIFGVREEESLKRKGRSVVMIGTESPLGDCINIIYNWSEAEVWEFIGCNLIDYCKLYDEGYSRLGCVGCPLGGRKKQAKEFERWPEYKNAYIRAFGRMIEARKRDGLTTEGWETGEDVMEWWLREKPGKTGENQITIDFCDGERGEGDKRQC